MNFGLELILIELLDVINQEEDKAKRDCEDHEDEVVLYLLRVLGDNLS